MLAAARLLPTAMMHERGIHGETVCPDLALPGKSFAPHQICPLSDGQETDPERAKGAH